MIKRRRRKRSFSRISRSSWHISFGSLRQLEEGFCVLLLRWFWQNGVSVTRRTCRSCCDHSCLILISKSHLNGIIINPWILFLFLFFLFLAWAIVAINSLNISIKSSGSNTIQNSLCNSKLYSSVVLHELAMEISQQEAKKKKKKKNKTKTNQVL